MNTNEKQVKEMTEQEKEENRKLIALGYELFFDDF